MGTIAERERARERATVAISSALTALASAGTSLLTVRDSTGDKQAQSMITALREDITRMLGDVQALREIVRASDRQAPLDSA